MNSTESITTDRAPEVRLPKVGDVDVEDAFSTAPSSRLSRFLAVSSVVLGLASAPVVLGGCSENPHPPIPRDELENYQPGGKSAATPAAVPTKAGEAPIGKPTGGCEEAGSNALGVMLGMAAAASLIARAGPGKSLPERLVSGGVAVIGAGVGASAMCGGAEPTLILAGATLANGILATAAAIPPSDSK